MTGTEIPGRRKKFVNTTHIDSYLPRSAGRKAEEEAVRLVGVDSLIRTRAASLLPEMLHALDDPFLINRQFAMRGLEQWLGRRFSDFGYRFYMTSDEREAPLRAIQAFTKRWQSQLQRAAASQKPVTRKQP